jgi:hypothetical protein
MLKFSDADLESFLPGIRGGKIRIRESDPQRWVGRKSRSVHESGQLFVFILNSTILELISVLHIAVL